MTVVLFFGGWNSPIDPRPILDFLHISFTPAIDLAGLGIWLLWDRAHRRAAGRPGAVGHRVDAQEQLVVPEVADRRASVLFNVIAVSALLIYSFLSFEVVVGPVLVHGQGIHFAFIFVWMRGTLPRSAHRPAHGLRMEVAH
jgi:hypothetical protein